MAIVTILKANLRGSLVLVEALKNLRKKSAKVERESVREIERMQRSLKPSKMKKEENIHTKEEQVLVKEEEVMAKVEEVMAKEEEAMTMA